MIYMCLSPPVISSQRVTFYMTFTSTPAVWDLWLRSIVILLWTSKPLYDQICVIFYDLCICIIIYILTFVVTQAKCFKFTCVWLEMEYQISWHLCCNWYSCSRICNWDTLCIWSRLDLKWSSICYILYLYDLTFDILYLYDLTFDILYYLIIDVCTQCGLIGPLVSLTVLKCVPHSVERYHWVRVVSVCVWSYIQYWEYFI
jgi:hypothetical protein